MRKIVIFTFCLINVLGCQNKNSLDQVFTEYDWLKLKSECIGRPRPEVYNGKIYEYWIGGKRRAFKKKGNKYFYIQHIEIKDSVIDSLEVVFNYRMEQFKRYGVLEMCPTYLHSIVFSSDSKVLPDYIKKLSKHKKYEVIFKKEKQYESLADYIKFDDRWYFRIDSIH